MDNENITQPEDLSTQEWAVLQHLAHLTDYFYMEDASLGFRDTSSWQQLNNTLDFSRYFNKLKTAGYLAIVPMAFANIKLGVHPLYALSPLGKKALHK